MGSKTILKSEFSAEKKYKAFFTGNQVEVENKGSHLFCQCSDSVNIIEVSSGNVISTIESEEDEITCLSLSPNDMWLAIGFQSANFKQYEVKNLENPSLLTSIKSYHRGPVSALCWDASSTYLATGSSDGTARVWDLKQKFCTHSLKGASGVFRLLMFDTNLHKRQWIFGAANNIIYIWLLQSGESRLISLLEGHTSAVTGMQLMQSEDRFVSCGLDKVIILWDLSTFSSLKIIPVFESLSGLIWKPEGLQIANSSNSDDNCILTVGNKGVLSLWNVEMGQELWKSAEPLMVDSTENEALLIKQMSLIKQQNSLLITTHDHSIILVDLKTQKISKLLTGYNDDIVDVLFVGEDDSHLAVATNSPLIRIYENSTLSCHFARGHTGNILGLAKHPTINTVFASCSHDNKVKIWKLHADGSAMCLATASGHTHSVGSVSLAQGFLITGSKDTCIKKWIFEEKSLLNSDNKELSLSASRTQSAHEKDINSVAISKNFALIASASQDKTVKVWDGNNLQLLGTLKGHKKSVWCAQFSPVDVLLATASADATIKIWNLSTYNNVATLEGHEVGVLRLAWISHGLQLVSTGSDGLLKVWVVKDKLCSNTFDEHEDRTFALAVAKDGVNLATAGSDSTIIWWKDITAEVLDKKHLESQRTVEEEQTLLNLIHKRKWKKALKYALHLKQPYRALNTLKELLDESPSELSDVLDKLSEEEITILLEFSVQWNTKTRNVRESQSIISYLLAKKLPEEIEKIPNWQGILEGLLPYTQRHKQRIDCLWQSACILQYLVTTTSIAPESWDFFSSSNKEDEHEDLLLLRNIPAADPQILERFTNINKSSASEGNSSEEESESSDGEGDNIKSIEDARTKFLFERIDVENDENSFNSVNEDESSDESDEEEVSYSKS